jgi:uncharacterized protein YggE
MASPDKGSRTLTVTGQGSVAVETSIAVIRLGVVIQGDTAQSVQQQLAERSERLGQPPQRAAGKRSANHRHFPLSPIRLPKSPPRLTGIQGQNSFQFEVPVARAGTSAG